MKEGDVLNGRYRLLFPIGEGGMGAVWRARQIQLDADVAIKVLHAKTAEGAGAISRFKREAKAAAALRSPHVVQVVDCDVDEATGTAFIAMELLEGESLAGRLVRKGKLGPEETARWVSHVARALARAHAAGVVHRDLKPANIFIVRNEDEELAKVLDFGIAKLVGQQHSDTATATGSLLGTPHYMSPEQIDPTRVVDYRADLWSLAVIACECLTGRRPFEGDTLASLAMKIALGRYDLPSSLGPVPRNFDGWFVKGTEVDPKRRFDSALELAATLREVVESGGVMISEPSNAPPPTTTRLDLTPSVPGLSARAAPVTERSGWRRGVALAASLVLLGGAGVWAASRRSPAPTGVLTAANAGRSLAVPSGIPAGPVASALDAGAGGASAVPEASAAGSEPMPSRELRAPGGASVRSLAPRAELESGSASSVTPAAGGRKPGALRRHAKRTTASTASSSRPKAAATAAPKEPVDAYDLP